MSTTQGDTTGENITAQNIAIGHGATVQVTTIYEWSRPKPADPAAAAARLAEMPTDALPPRAPLPPNSRITYGDNRLFVGREADLKCLAATLKGGTETAVIGQVAAATGLGGIGKTQLAVEFAHRYGQFFAGGVFWLSFADGGAVPAEVALCGQCLGLPGFDALAFEAQVQQVRQAWQEPTPRLLVFDNCEEETLLAEWKPKTGGCRVLVTSRRADWSAPLGVQLLPLGVLKREESIALLREMTGNDDAALGKIADELGDLPLALHLAGSYLARYQSVTPLSYLEQLRQPDLLAHRSLVGKHLERDNIPNPTGHEWAVARTFAMSYDRLKPADEIDALALALLARAAHFAPGEPIPRDLLFKTLEKRVPSTARPQREKRSLFQSIKRLFSAGSPPTPEPQPPNPEDGDDALRRLLELGLLEHSDPRTPDSPQIHRLLAAFVRGTAEDEGAQAAVEQAVIDYTGSLGTTATPGMWLVLPHLHHLQMIGDYQAARPYYERALAICERVLGPDHPDTATSLNNLGYLLQAMGQLEAARPYAERALAIRERVLGPDHPDTASSLNNLGYLLRAMGQREAARPYYERALAIWERVLGPDHPHTALSLNNLGALLRAMGQLEAARPYYERALAIFTARLGENHPHTQIVRKNLAVIEQEIAE